MRAIILAAAFLSSAPAAAEGVFVATLAQPAASPRTMVRETLWSCAGAECRAPRSGLSSDMNECRGMTRRLGRVTGFTAGTKPFDAALLDRCNAGLAD